MIPTVHQQFKFSFPRDFQYTRQCDSICTITMADMVNYLEIKPGDYLKLSSALQTTVIKFLTSITLADILLGYKKDNDFLNKHKGLVFSVREFPGHKLLHKNHQKVQWLRTSATGHEIFPEECAIVFKSQATLGRWLAIK